MKTTLLAAAFLMAAAPMAFAGPIDSACLSGGRSQANRALCGCIQQVADQTLSQSDQRRAAKFFKNPHQAQEVRQSGRASDEAFWQRYKNFGVTAEAYCAG
ncbi:hypothetical protein [Phaeovulum sp.]|uniref:hypothetical protein n=1 Tax=Phaeovulum sp. TaxID=2934796 RepID=UPI0039E6A585